jgi:DNA (cytosine-5)-methyltransferase 1
MIYYNDNDEYCCRVLKARIADGRLPDGVVDNRDIREIPSDELKQYTQIHLFAGIGGLALGVQWADFGPDRSIITAGFPCQDLSTAGKGAGLKGDRSGLWWETYAAISVVRPDVIFVENVSALLTRGVGTVLGSLATLGYRVEWHCVPAAYVGAPHRRDRIWIVGVRDVADTDSEGLQGPEREIVSGEERQSGRYIAECGEDVADTNTVRLQHRTKEQIVAGELQRESEGSGASPTNIARWGVECRLGVHTPRLRSGLDDCGGWECGVPRVAKGQPNRVKRLKALGNSVVPQCAEFVFRHIMAASE